MTVTNRFNGSNLNPNQMKNIEFTQEEIENNLRILEVKKLMGTSGLNSSIEKLRIAKIAPEGSTISIKEAEILVTPAKAFEEMSKRKQAARAARDKEDAKRIISELENTSNEALVIIQDWVAFFTSSSNPDTEDLLCKSKDFINNKLF